MLLNEIPFCKCILVNRNSRNRSSKFIRNIQANLIQNIAILYYNVSLSWSFLQYCKCNGKYKNAHIKKGKVLCQMNTCGKV